jgi:hypothetical protein
LASNLGRIAGLQNAEEVFICSMFSRLGDILAIYYFAEEYDEILELARTSGIDELRASRAILGVGFDVLGIEVARRWNFPPNVLHRVAEPPGVLPQAAAEREWIAHCAGFARELCEAAWRTPDPMRDEALSMLTTRFAATFPQVSKYLRPLIAHSLKLGENYCKALGIPTTDSPLIEGLGKWAMLEPATAALPRAPGHRAAPSQHERSRKDGAQARKQEREAPGKSSMANRLKSLKLTDLAWIIYGLRSGCDMLPLAAVKNSPRFRLFRNHRYPSGAGLELPHGPPIILPASAHRRH